MAGKRTTVGSRKRSPAKRVPVKRAPAKRAAAKPAPAKRAPAQPAAGHRARSLARRLALQALYQMQLNPRSWSDTQKQFAADPEADRVDLDYFRDPAQGHRGEPRDVGFRDLRGCARFPCPNSIR